VQDPEFFLNQLGVQLSCVVDTSQPAVIDSTHRISIGYETFFVASDQARREFESDIVRYCGILTDPVTKARFRPTQDSPRERYNDREYYFASDNSRRMFGAMPDMYADPAYRMIEETETTDR